MHSLVVLASVFLTISAASPNCPPPAEIQPCTCDGEGFNCRKAIDDKAIQKAMKARAEEEIVRSIYIQGTPIKRLTAGIFGNFKFGQFHMDVNQISVIESGVFSGSRSTVSLISLYRNELTSFPFKDIENLPYLEALMLSRNKLTTIPGPSAFGNHQNLRAVMLASNSISRIGRRAFSGLPLLEALDLSDNKLVALESQVFYMANFNYGLQIVLGNNSISKIAPDAFGQITPMEILLPFNHLTSIPEEPFLKMMLGNANGRTNVVVTGNPLTCKGCSYRWIVNYKYSLQNMMHGFACADHRNLASLTLRNIEC